MPILPPPYLDTVVALGFPGTDDKPKYLATAFLVGRPLPRDKRGGAARYELFLVTNKHVLEGEKSMTIRFNPDAEGAAKEFAIDLGEPVWFAHPEVDIAVLAIQAPRLLQEGIRFSFFRCDTQVAGLKRTAELGLCEGDGVFVLGFPLGLVGEHRNYAVVRQGAIARIRDTIAGTTQEFLVDATVFPGNSGGPVVSRPEFAPGAVDGPRGRSYLLGIVASYVPYRDVAISQQTKRTRVVFEENSGLTAVIPSEHIVKTIDEASEALADQRPVESVAIDDDEAVADRSASPARR
jgi:hypothetical protein